MKKYFCYIISLILIFSLTGCEGKKSSDNTSMDKFDINEAISITKEYLDNVIKGEPGKNNELLSQDVSDKDINVDLKNELAITNYDIYEYNELGKSTSVKVYISRNDKIRPYSSVDTMSIKVIKVDDEYKIDKIINLNEREVYVDGDTIKYRDKEDVKTKVILKTKNLPEFAFNKYLTANSVKIPVERGAFDKITLGISGENLAVSTYKDNSFIFLVNIKQTQETVNGSKSSNGQQQGESGDTGEREENYIGKEIKETGILFNKKVEEMSFSPDGRYLVVQYTSPKENSIAIYDVKGNEEAYLGLDKKFDFSKVDLSILKVEKGSVKVNSIKKNNVKDEEVKDMVGEFSIDLENYEIEKK